MCCILLEMQALVLSQVDLGYLSKIYSKNQALDDREGGKAFLWQGVGNLLLQGLPPSASCVLGAGAKHNNEK